MWANGLASTVGMFIFWGLCWLKLTALPGEAVSRTHFMIRIRLRFALHGVIFCFNESCFRGGHWVKKRPGRNVEWRVQHSQ